MTINNNIKSTILAMIGTLSLITGSLVCILSMRHLNTLVQYYPHY